MQQEQQQDDQSSFVQENLITLKRVKYLPYVKRSYIFLTCGPNLIFAICELLYNLVTNSSNKNLSDKKTIRCIKKHFPDIGILISQKSSLKTKRKIINENKEIQGLAFNVALNGFEFYKSNGK